LKKIVRRRVRKEIGNVIYGKSVGKSEAEIGVGKRARERESEREREREREREGR
jgi:hypothetical protein